MRNPTQVYLALTMFCLTIAAMFAMFFAISKSGIGWGL